MLTSVSNPDLHLLRVFIAVAESGGFSKAQIALNVSQSTISTQMIDLETRLGMRLCRRGRVGFGLTDEGHEVFKYAKDLVQDCDEFVGKVNGIRGDLSGELRIATADSLLGNKAFPFETILAELREAMPAVVLHLSVMDPLEIERLVLEQKLHMGIHTFPNHVPGLRYIKMFDETQILYCGHDHPLFDGDLTYEGAELETYDYAGRSYYGGALRPGNLKTKNNHIYAGSMDGIAAAILSGRFLGHLPVQCAQTWVEQGKMKPLSTEFHSYKVTFECVFPIGTRMANIKRVLEEVMSKYSA
ncbi:MAG: LysR family transcriptional regulator [Paracoccaceae bacterium]|nr:LysR family transcriptional regulator [Paracoccaceae bacterium]